ncbi:MAG: hypothetical protein JW918_05050 [Anaerolineae bacterium]|nr:hypothetical protein [Anaerolineae bacterium]
MTQPKKRSRKRVIVAVVGTCLALLCVCLGVIGGWLLIGEGGRSPLRDLLPNQLTEKHSDRICLGSDLVTRLERLGPELQRYDAFLDQLSEEARENVCWRTAERVYGGNKGKV